jgi:hypothetical protein
MSDQGAPERAGLRTGSRSFPTDSYYGMPALKPSHYAWPIAGYFFIGGLASAAQFIATVLDLVGGREDRPAVRAGRYLAFLGALASPPLLIVDLETPRRWYNMLRIFRPTSTMSIGSWALTAFGTFSSLVAMGQAVEDLLGWVAGRWLARVFSLPAALAGGVVALYTGTLLAATNLPLWAGSFPFLSSLFASSATSTATAALTLATDRPGAPQNTRRRLSWLALIAGAAELFFAALIEHGWRQRQVAAPIEGRQLGLAWHAGVLGLGIAAPLVVHVLEVLVGRTSRRASALTALATLAGGFILRVVLIFGGKASTRRPEDYLRMTGDGGQQTAEIRRPTADGRQQTEQASDFWLLTTDF